MKKLILIGLLLAFGASPSMSQQPCQVMGQKNPHGMTMTVSKVAVVDTVNFSVTSIKALPFVMKAADTVWFDVCVKPQDGKMHSTQIRYTTEMGVISYNVSVKAPTNAGVNPNAASTLTLKTYPNPVSKSATIMLGSPSSGQLEIYSTQGEKVLSLALSEVSRCDVPVASLPNGSYIARFRSNSGEVSQSNLTVSH